MAFSVLRQGYESVSVLSRPFGLRRSPERCLVFALRRDAIKTSSASVTPISKPLLTMKSKGIGSSLTAAVIIATATSPASAGLIKASPAPPSPFIEHPQALTHDPNRTPFNRVERNPSPKAWARVRDFHQIVILPVNTRYLRQKNGAPQSAAQVRAANEMAAYLHASVVKAFLNGGQYQVVSHPGHKTLSLELAVVELHPTNVAVNVVGTAAGAVVPGANFVGSVISRGGIAVEGKLRNAETGELLMEFTDREHDKTSLFSFRDYSPYAHARRSADDWAKELEALSRTPRTQKVPSAAAITLNPF